jgi:hypothetical protein
MKDSRVHAVGDINFVIATSDVRTPLNKQNVHKPSTANFKTQKAATNLFSLNFPT